MQATILCLLLLFLQFSTSLGILLTQLCQGGKYIDGSIFQSNLNFLLSSLRSKNPTFFTAEKGSDLDRVYGLVLCRGDISQSGCSICLNGATENIVNRCSYSRQATIWYDDCQLRYSDVQFFQAVNNTDAQLLDTKANATNPLLFNKLAKQLMSDISRQAAYSPLMFASGKILNTSDSFEIYGLVQCTRDLSGYDCSDCLQQIIGYYWMHYSGLNGGRILGKSCNFRYEVYLFYQGEPTVTLSFPSVTESRPTEAGKKKSNHTVLISCIIAGILLVLMSLGCFIFLRKKPSKNTFDKGPNLEGVSSIESIFFKLQVLRIATSDFSAANELGHGGFGTVYKGVLHNGEEIAVKRLSRSSNQGIRELKNELLLVAKLQHNNLVRLLGFCLEGEEKLLVYEYVPHRSLDTFLFDATKRNQLTWDLRFNIIKGIAHGLLYLHEESPAKVIHRDLKASNVLLDADMKPKISDFGLAKLFGRDETQRTTNHVVGTPGYIAPEYARYRKISAKLDIYSFGVLILEIVIGRKNSNFGDSEDAQDIISYTWEHWSKETTPEIVDQSLGDNYSKNEAFKCIQIGLLCAQYVPANRPHISEIVLMLHGHTSFLPIPLQPTFVPEKKNIISGLIGQSANEVTISDLEPR